MKSLLQGLGLLAASLGVSFVALELGFRWIGVDEHALSAEAIWEAQNQSGQGHARARMAGYEFRDSPITEKAFAPNTHRLLFLGDSFTAGSGIPNDDRFPDRLERRLRRTAQGGDSVHDVHVFNAGKDGTVPAEWDQYLEKLLPAYRPHAVIAVFFLRDGTPLSTSLKLNEPIIEQILRRYERKPLYQHSHMARFFYHRLAWRDFSNYYELRVIASYLGSKDDRIFWTRQQRALLRMAQRCRALSIPFHLVIFPMLFDLQRYDYFPVEDEIARFARESGIPFFSLIDGFLGRDASALWVASNDQHPNERGHAIAAETLYPYLRRVVDALGRSGSGRFAP